MNEDLGIQKRYLHESLDKIHKELDRREKMPRTLIQKYSTSSVKNLIEKMNDLHGMNHRLTEGQLRELFVSNILNQFLTNQFSVGSGIIINRRGDQSRQMDIIVYDNRILPPFIKEQYIGVYPAESVIATIEVKSQLSRRELQLAEKSARKLYSEVYNYALTNGLPLCTVFGFYGDGVSELRTEESGKSWLSKDGKINSLCAICLVGEYSWVRTESGWNFQVHDSETYEETKRFFAVVLDNIRTLSQKRMEDLREHKDWLGSYIRDFSV